MDTEEHPVDWSPSVSLKARARSRHSNMERSTEACVCSFTGFARRNEVKNKDSVLKIVKHGLKSGIDYHPVLLSRYEDTTLDYKGGDRTLWSSLGVQCKASSRKERRTVRTAL